VAFIQSGPCRVSRNDSLSCDGAEQRRRLPEKAFDFDAITGSASVTFRLGGTVNHVAWSDPEQGRGTYTNECDSGDTDGGGVEQALRAQGSLLGHELSTHSKFDWASMFVGAGLGRCGPYDPRLTDATKPARATPGLFGRRKLDRTSVSDWAELDQAGHRAQRRMSIGATIR
jgi:hypothetical protein